MVTLKLLFLFLAAVCFLLAAVGVPTTVNQSRGNLTAAGLLFWLLATNIGGVGP